MTFALNIHAFLGLGTSRTVYAPRSIHVFSTPPSLVEDPSPKFSHHGQTSYHWVDHFLRHKCWDVISYLTGVFIRLGSLEF